MQFSFSRFIVAILVMALGISACGRGVIPPLPQDESDKSGATEAVIKYVPPPVQVTITATNYEGLTAAEWYAKNHATPTAADNKPEEFDLNLPEDSTSVAMQENLNGKLPNLVTEKCVPLQWNMGGRARREVCGLYLNHCITGGICDTRSQQPLHCFMRINVNGGTERNVDCDTYDQAFEAAPKQK